MKHKTEDTKKPHINKNKSSNLLFIYLAVFVSVVILIATALFTYAYLTDVFEADEIPSFGGTPQITLFEKISENNYIEITENDIFTLEINGLGEPITPELYIRNTGNIDVIFKISVDITFSDGQYMYDLLQTDATLANSGWINVDRGQPNTYAIGDLNYNEPNINSGLPFPFAFDALYNSVLEANSDYVSVFDSITLANDFEFGAPTTLTFQLVLTTLAHSGNPYQFNEHGAFDSHGYDFSADFLNNVWTAWKES